MGQVAMKPLKNRDFLHLWEHGSSMHPLDGALLALGLALPEAQQGMLADWPLGRRNRALVDLRCACFGSRLQAWAACARCAEKMEFELDGKDLAQSANDADYGGGAALVVDGQKFRLPTSRDVALVAGETDPDIAARRLAERCRIASDDCAARPVTDLEEVGRQMSLADPMAEILIALACPACGHDNSSHLDIAGFLWTEIEAHAKRLLLEVHALASAYGWTEQTVLSLSDRRRAAYLQLVRE
jgi:hypothetical protein